MTMLRLTILSLLITSPLLSYAGDEAAKQAELDAACEAARQVALAPKKFEVYQECMTKYDREQKSEQVCLSEGDAYNGYRVNGAPLFYDLPECEVAFNNKKQYRRAD
jgi:hypothetical protein